MQWGYNHTYLDLYYILLCKKSAIIINHMRKKVKIWERDSGQRIWLADVTIDNVRSAINNLSPCFRREVSCWGTALHWVVATPSRPCFLMTCQPPTAGACLVPRWWRGCHQPHRRRQPRRTPFAILHECPEKHNNKLVRVRRGRIKIFIFLKKATKLLQKFFKNLNWCVLV